jgi:hypothetical protein
VRFFAGAHHGVAYSRGRIGALLDRLERALGQSAQQG